MAFRKADRSRKGIRHGLWKNFAENLHYPLSWYNRIIHLLPPLVGDRRAVNVPPWGRGTAKGNPRQRWLHFKSRDSRRISGPLRTVGYVCVL